VGRIQNRRITQKGAFQAPFALFGKETAKKRSKVCFALKIKGKSENKKIKKILICG
jgi:hypothetical protein